MTDSRHKFRAVMIFMTLTFALVLGTATWIAAAGKSDNWRLLVKTAACVKGPVVLLGEIADPAPGVDQRTWNSISQIKLWKASAKRGRPVTIDRDKLSKVLKFYMGEMTANLILPSQLTVQTGGSVVDSEELRQRVVAFLTPRAQSMGGEISMRELKLPMYYFFDNPYDKLSVELDDAIRPGRNQIRLKGVSSDGKMLSSKAGSVFIDVWKTVPAAGKPMNRNERVTRDNVTFVRVNLAYKDNLWDGTGGPWRMVRPLGRGQPFTMSHIEHVPVIEKGERVVLVYKNSRIQVSIRAEALGEAGIGQQVSVRNLQSNKVVLATVVNDDTVMVR